MSTANRLRGVCWYYHLLSAIWYTRRIRLRWALTAAAARLYNGSKVKKMPSARWSLTSSVVKPAHRMAARSSPSAWRKIPTWPKKKRSPLWKDQGLLYKAAGQHPGTHSAWWVRRGGFGHTAGYGDHAVRWAKGRDSLPSWSVRQWPAFSVFCIKKYCNKYYNAKRFLFLLLFV